MTYDPIKAHEYYLRTRELNPRTAQKVDNVLARKSGTKVVPKASSQRSTSSTSVSKRRAEAQARVVRLTNKLHSLQNALKSAHEALAAKRVSDQKSRATAAKTEKENSDGKSTADEKLASKKYRESHKTELDAKAKATSSSSGSTSSSTLTSMSTSELQSRVTKIESLIRSTQSQIKAASALTHSLSHSEFIDNPSFIVHKDGIERPLTLNREGDGQNGRR